MITFTDTAINASGITKGKTALIYGIGVQRSGYDQLFVRVLQEVADDDGDGLVTLPFADGLPHGMVWAVFDLTNNQYTIAASPGFVPVAVELPRDAFRRGGAGNAVVRFAFNHPSLELLYVHPGKAVWSWSAMDGRALDRDGPMASRLSMPRTASAPPERITTPPSSRRAARSSPLIGTSGSMRPSASTARFWAAPQ